MTLSVFQGEAGVFGMPMAVQKSSASLPERYLWRVMGVDSIPFLGNPPSFSFSLLVVAGSFIRHTNEWPAHVGGSGVC